MFTSNQIEAIEKQKTKAFSVFNKVKDDLIKTIVAAETYISVNKLDIETRKNEITELSFKNDVLAGEINSMQSQVEKIVGIIG